MASNRRELLRSLAGLTLAPLLPALAQPHPLDEIVRAMGWVRRSGGGSALIEVWDESQQRWTLYPHWVVSVGPS